MHVAYFLLIHVIKFNLLTIFMFINVNLHLNTFSSSVFFGFLLFFFWLLLNILHAVA